MDGIIQIGAVYLQTGNSGGRPERIHTMRLLINEMAKGGGGKALNILTGDFNYVDNQRDRISGAPAVFTGLGDGGEASSSVLT